MIALLVVTDGRDDYLAQAVQSAAANLIGPITERWMYDDTGDDQYRAALRCTYPQFRHLEAGPRQGFGGAIRAAWSALAAKSDARFVLHLEQDFTFNTLIDLGAMSQVLDAHPYLVQLALRRQPWNDAERDAGGIVEQHPDAYTDRMDRFGAWLEHRLFFTTNPSLYRRTLCETSWPEGGNSEGHYSHQLLRDGTPEVQGEHVRFGFWGTRESGEWVTHVGHQRAGVGY